MAVVAQPRELHPDLVATRARHAQPPLRVRAVLLERVAALARRDQRAVGAHERLRGHVGQHPAARDRVEAREAAALAVGQAALHRVGLGLQAGDAPQVLLGALGDGAGRQARLHLALPRRGERVVQALGLEVAALAREARVGEVRRRPARLQRVQAALVAGDLRLQVGLAGTQPVELLGRAGELVLQSPQALGGRGDERVGLLLGRGRRVEVAPGSGQVLVGVADAAVRDEQLARHRLGRRRGLLARCARRDCGRAARPPTGDAASAGDVPVRGHEDELRAAAREEERRVEVGDQVAAVQRAPQPREHRRRTVQTVGQRLRAQGGQVLCRPGRRRAIRDQQQHPPDVTGAHVVDRATCGVAVGDHQRVTQGAQCRRDRDRAPGRHHHVVGQRPQDPPQRPRPVGVQDRVAALARLGGCGPQRVGAGLQGRPPALQLALGLGRGVRGGLAPPQQRLRLGHLARQPRRVGVQALDVGLRCGQVLGQLRRMVGQAGRLACQAPVLGRVLRQRRAQRRDLPLPAQVRLAGLGLAALLGGGGLLVRAAGLLALGAGLLGRRVGGLREALLGAHALQLGAQGRRLGAQLRRVAARDRLLDGLHQAVAALLDASHQTAEALLQVGEAEVHLGRAPRLGAQPGDAGLQRVF